MVFLILTTTSEDSLISEDSLTVSTLPLPPAGLAVRPNAPPRPLHPRRAHRPRLRRPLPLHALPPAPTLESAARPPRLPLFLRLRNDGVHRRRGRVASAAQVSATPPDRAAGDPPRGGGVQICAVQLVGVPGDEKRAAAGE